MAWLKLKQSIWQKDKSNQNGPIKTQRKYIVLVGATPGGDSYRLGMLVISLRGVKQGFSSPLRPLFLAVSKYFLGCIQKGNIWKTLSFLFSTRFTPVSWVWSTSTGSFLGTQAYSIISGIRSPWDYGLLVVTFRSQKSSNHTHIGLL